MVSKEIQLLYINSLLSKKCTKKAVSNIDYFGEPIYTYSSKQGMRNGFLSPYKSTVCRLNADAGGSHTLKVENRYKQLWD